MAEVVELIPVSERDQIIFEAWENGKGLRTLAREFNIPVAEVERALDRQLPAFDASNQLRAFKRELQRLEELSGQFFALAKRDADHESAHLVARINERICSMRGWSSVNIRMNPMAVQVAQQPSRHEKIRAALMRLKHGPDWQPGDGNEQPNNRSGAVDTLSDSNDKDASH